jgi:hypothetical protein
VKTHQIERSSLIYMELMKNTNMNSDIANLISEWCAFDEAEKRCLNAYGIVNYDFENLSHRPDLMKMLTASLMKPYAKLDYSV